MYVLQRGEYCGTYEGRWMHTSGDGCLFVEKVKALHRGLSVMLSATGPCVYYGVMNLNPFYFSSVLNGG